MTVAPALRMGDLLRSEFRTSTEGDALNGRLMKELRLDYRYQPARLAIALSLADARTPNVPLELLGKPIRGETLFGAEESEVALWVALVAERASLTAPTRREIIDLVAGHWLRGARALARRADSATEPLHIWLPRLLQEAA